MKYISRFISARLGCDIKLIHADQFNKENSPSNPVILNYGPNPLEGCFNIFSDGLMFKTGIDKTGYRTFSTGRPDVSFSGPGRIRFAV